MEWWQEIAKNFIILSEVATSTFLGFHLIDSISGNRFTTRIPIENKRIIGVKNIAKAERITTEHCKLNFSNLIYVVNLKTKEIWAEYENNKSYRPQSYIKEIDPTYYKLDAEISDEQMIDFIRLTVIKQYELYPDKIIGKENLDKAYIGGGYCKLDRR